MHHPTDCMLGLVAVVEQHRAEEHPLPLYVRPCRIITVEMSNAEMLRTSYTNAGFCQNSEYYKSPHRRQSPVGAQTVHILDTSLRSIQAEPTTKPYGQEVYEEEQEFFEEMILDDRGTVQDKKFVVVHNQSADSNRRYEYIPMQQQHQRIASPPPKVLYHEEVDASTGRLHRYATIPSDDECEEMEKQLDASKRFALVPVEEVRSSRGRYAVLNVQPELNRSPSIRSPQIQPTRRVPPNPIATQKLHELLTTPKKTLQTLRTLPSPIETKASRAQQKLNYHHHHHIQEGKRHTAIVAPICSSPLQPVYNETTFISKAECSPNVSAIKTPMNATITVAAFMMILCGCVTTGLCIYMISFLGRMYYLDFSILAGFVCFLLGLLGFRTRHVFWLPNRNYLSGYFVLSVFSLLTCIGLLVLLFMQPKPGTLLADMTSGAVCGISVLSLCLASVGIVASYCCHAPPPDNRVQHCSPGFHV